MGDLPTGTVTFLFTDVEGSTALWERHEALMRAVTARHDALLDALITQHGGHRVRERGEGDSLFVVFTHPTDAVGAALAMARAVLAEPWPGETSLRVRLGLHTGSAQLRAGDYYGPVVNRCAPAPPPLRRMRVAVHHPLERLRLPGAPLQSRDLAQGGRVGQPHADARLHAR
jgi:class 3 adenylate cyclase